MKKISVYLFMLMATAFFACEEEDLNPGGEDNPTELSGVQETDIVLENIFDDPTLTDYYVTGEWDLYANVVVMPGVNIMMKQDAAIFVNQEASFKASGTETQPITIFGQQPNKGYWTEITFDDSNNQNNILNYVIMSDGGGGFADGLVGVRGNSQVTVTNCIFQNSEKHGFFVAHADGKIPGFSTNIISDCDLSPVRLNLEQLHYLDETIFFLDNEKDYVEVDGGEINSNVSWKRLQGYAVFLSSYNSIYADVTVEPGAVFKMASETAIRVEPEGSLKMVGTPTERITFIADVESPGYFSGIVYEDSNNPLNELQYVDISYGGSAFAFANLRVAGSTSIKIGNSSFNHSAEYGIYVSRYATFEDLGNNSFTGNTSDDIYVQE